MPAPPQTRVVLPPPVATGGRGRHHPRGDAAGDVGGDLEVADLQGHVDFLAGVAAEDIAGGPAMELVVVAVGLVGGDDVGGRGRGTCRERPS